MSAHQDEAAAAAADGGPRAYTLEEIQAMPPAPGMPAAPKSVKEYIGDAVYADFDGYHVVLTTEDGYRATNRIALEPAVYAKLVRYVEWLKRQQEAG